MHYTTSGQRTSWTEATAKPATTARRRCTNVQRPSRVKRGGTDREAERREHVTLRVLWNDARVETAHALFYGAGSGRNARKTPKGRAHKRAADLEWRDQRKRRGRLRDPHAGERSPNTRRVVEMRRRRFSPCFRRDNVSRRRRESAAPDARVCRSKRRRDHGRRETLVLGFRAVVPAPRNVCTAVLHSIPCFAARRWHNDVYDKFKGRALMQAKKNFWVFPL